MLRILRRAAGQNEIPITTETGLRSAVEDRGREAAKVAGKGASIDEMRAVDPDLVDEGDIIIDGGNSNYRDDVRRRTRSTTAYVSDERWCRRWPRSSAHTQRTSAALCPSASSHRCRTLDTRTRAASAV